MTTPPAIMYRYDDYACEGRIEICERQFPVRRSTPCGVWVYDPGRGKDRWVSLGATRSFAYPSTKAAMRSFTVRKKRQHAHLAFGLKVATEILDMLEKGEMTRDQGELDFSLPVEM